MTDQEIQQLAQELIDLTIAIKKNENKTDELRLHLLPVVKKDAIQCLGGKVYYRQETEYEKIDLEILFNLLKSDYNLSNSELDDLKDKSSKKVVSLESIGVRLDK